MTEGHNHCRCHDEGHSRKAYRFRQWFLRPVIAYLEDCIMTAITDLTAGVADLRQAVADEIDAVNAKLGATGSDDPAVVQAVSDLAALASQVRGETSTVNGDAAPTA